MIWLFTFVLNILYAAPPKISMEDAFAELNGELVLHFRNATTGDPVSNATIVFEGSTQQTNSKGAVTFSFPDVGVAETVRYASFSKPGFVSAKLPVTFMAGTIWFTDFSVTENLQIDELRIVLDWQAKPADLDAHLIKENEYHISYRKMKNYQDIAILDRDDRDGYGPETITIQNFDETGKYSYIVHDYSNRTKSNSKALSKGGAQVFLYSNNGLEGHYKLQSEQSGNVWKVFSVSNGQITSVNAVTTYTP